MVWPLGGSLCCSNAKQLPYSKLRLQQNAKRLVESIDLVVNHYKKMHGVAAPAPSEAE